MDSDVDEVSPEVLESIRRLNLTSCDFVGDSGCCEPTCWQCHSSMGPENLRMLAKNLSIAGQLCRAWQQRDVDSMWRPGCNLEGLR